MGPAGWAVKPWVTKVLTAIPVPPTDVAMTQTLQSLKDTQHRALLLQAQAGAVRRQQRGLQDPMQRLQNQLKRLQDMQRKAKVDVTFGPVVSAAPALEPEVLVRILGYVGTMRSRGSSRTH